MQDHVDIWTWYVKLIILLYKPGFGNTESLEMQAEADNHRQTETDTMTERQAAPEGSCQRRTQTETDMHRQTQMESSLHTQTDWLITQTNGSINGSRFMMLYVLYILQMQKKTAFHNIGIIMLMLIYYS